MKNQQPIYKVEYLIENIIDAQIASCIEELSEEPFGYCEYITHPITIRDYEAKKGYVLKITDWYDTKEIATLFRKTNE